MLDKNKLQKNVLSVVDRLYEAYTSMDGLLSSVNETLEIHQQHEKERESCSCESEILGDLSEMLTSFMHVTQTYGHMIERAVELLSEHDPKPAPKEVREAIRVLARSLVNRDNENDPDSGLN